mmetsp:Transcript_19484/g.47771  ORF Transcript_19484/g.47771 Transcript_19484/m.47771 type:complete len:133 (+) Transcript_19484:1-399(+)
MTPRARERHQRYLLSTVDGAKGIEIDRLFSSTKDLFQKTGQKTGQKSGQKTESVAYGRTDTSLQGYVLFQDVEMGFDRTVQCPACGMVYFPGRADEVALHGMVHKCGPTKGPKLSNLCGIRMPCMLVTTDCL